MIVARATAKPDGPYPIVGWHEPASHATQGGGPHSSARSIEDGYESTQDVRTNNASGLVAITSKLKTLDEVQREQARKRTNDMAANKANKTEQDWYKDVHIGEEHTTRRSEIIDLLYPFAKMWDGHL